MLTHGPVPSSMCLLGAALGQALHHCCTRLRRHHLWLVLQSVQAAVHGSSSAGGGVEGGAGGAWWVAALPVFTYAAQQAHQLSGGLLVALLAPGPAAVCVARRLHFYHLARDA